MKFKVLISLLMFGNDGDGCRNSSQCHRATDRHAIFATRESSIQARAQVTATATVVNTEDGNILRVKSMEKPYSERFTCIDAAKRTQKPWGSMAAAQLKQLLPKGQAIQVGEIDRDRHGRTAAELYVRNQSINLQMVQEGMAVIYPHYLNGCAATKDQ